MITELKRFIVSKDRYVAEYRGNSSDVKPTGKINGSKFHEIDTGIDKMYDEEHNRWIIQPKAEGGGIEEAPFDGNTHGRKDGTWVVIDNQGKAYAQLRKVQKGGEDWLFEALYQSGMLDKEFALNWMAENYRQLNQINQSNSNSKQTLEQMLISHTKKGAACSAIYKDGLMGGNIDWYLDNCMPFVTRTTNGVIGAIAGVTSLTKEFVESGEYNETIYKVLPFLLNSGQNKQGLFCKLNVVPTFETKGGTEYTVPTTGTNVGGTDICAMALPMIMLEECHSVQEMKNLLNNANIYCPYSMRLAEEVHLLFGSVEEQYICEFKNNQVIIKDVTNTTPWMTNFYVNDATFNPDGTVDWHSLTDHPMGVYRNDLIANDYANIHNAVDMMRMIQLTLRYTTAYIDDNWIDEFCSNYGGTYGDLTIQVAKEHPEQFDPILAIVRQWYQEYDRDAANIWQTVVSAVHDLNNNRMQVVVQEQGMSMIHSFNIEPEMDYVQSFQGTEFANMILGIDQDGYVVPVQSAAGSSIFRVQEMPEHPVDGTYILYDEGEGVCDIEQRIDPEWKQYYKRTLPEFIDIQYSNGWYDVTLTEPTMLPKLKSNKKVMMFKRNRVSNDEIITLRIPVALVLTEMVGGHLLSEMLIPCSEEEAEFYANGESSSWNDQGILLPIGVDYADIPKDIYLKVSEEYLNMFTVDLESNCLVADEGSMSFNSTEDLAELMIYLLQSGSFEEGTSDNATLHLLVDYINTDLPQQRICIKVMGVQPFVKEIVVVDGEQILTIQKTLPVVDRYSSRPVSSQAVYDYVVSRLRPIEDELNTLRHHVPLTFHKPTLMPFDAGEMSDIFEAVARDNKDVFLNIEETVDNVVIEKTLKCINVYRTVDKEQGKETTTVEFVYTDGNGMMGKTVLFKYDGTESTMEIKEEYYTIDVNGIIYKPTQEQFERILKDPTTVRFRFKQSSSLPATYLYYNYAHITGDSTDAYTFASKLGWTLYGSYFEFNFLCVYANNPELPASQLYTGKTQTYAMENKNWDVEQPHIKYPTIKLVHDTIFNIIDIGNGQYIYKDYSLPAIDVDVLRTVYANDVKNAPQKLKWQVLGTETQLTVVSSDHIVDNYSIDVLVHNKYHCEYTWTDETTGIVNPNVKDDSIEKATTISDTASDDKLATELAIYNYIASGNAGKPRALDNIDLNTVLATGFYSCNVCTNRPTENNGTMVVIKNASSADHAVQFYSTFVANKLWVRHRTNGTWGNWSEIQTGSKFPVIIHDEEVNADDIMDEGIHYGIISLSGIDEADSLLVLHHGDWMHQLGFTHNQHVWTRHGVGGGWATWDVLANMSDPRREGMHFEVVDELPETGDDLVIYLMLKEQQENATVKDDYDMYVWVDDIYQRIGNTQIDLSGKVDKTTRFSTTTDTNTVVESGIYYSSNWSNVPSGANAFGHLEVFSAGDDGQGDVRILQLYSTGSRNKTDIWVRKHSETSWGSWVKLANADDLANKVDKSEIQTITLEASATGTLTEEQLSIILNNPRVAIKRDGRIYHFAMVYEGYTTFSSIRGTTADNVFLESIIINNSTGEWQNRNINLITLINNRVAKSNAHRILYGTDNSGNQDIWTLDTNAKPWTVPYREENTGAVKVGNATDNAHAIPKGQADNTYLPQAVEDISNKITWDAEELGENMYVHKAYRIGKLYYISLAGSVQVTHGQEIKLASNVKIDGVPLTNYDQHTTFRCTDLNNMSRLCSSMITSAGNWWVMTESYDGELYLLAQTTFISMI